MVGWPLLVGPFPDQSLRRGLGLVSAQPRKDNAQGHTARCSQPPWSHSVLLLLPLCWSRASAISSHAAWISSPITSTDLGSPPSISPPPHPLAMGLHACTLGCTELPHPLSPSESPSHMLLSSPPTAATSWWLEAPLPPCMAASRHSFSLARFRGNAASEFLVRTPQTQAPICP